MPTAVPTLQRKDGEEEVDGRPLCDQLVVNVLGLATTGSSSSLKPRSTNSHTELENAIRDGVGRSTLVSTILRLTDLEVTDSNGKPRLVADTEIGSAETPQSPELQPFTVGDVKYLYHGCLQRPMARSQAGSDKSNGATSEAPSQRAPASRPVKLHIIEQITPIPQPATASAVAAPKVQPRANKPAPPLPAEPARQQVASPNRDLHARISKPPPSPKPKPPAKLKQKLPVPTPVAAGKPSNQPPVSPGVRKRNSSSAHSEVPSENGNKIEKLETPSTPSKENGSNAKLPKSDVKQEAQLVIDQLKDETLRIGAYLMVVDATADQVRQQEQKDYFLKLQKVLLTVAGPAPTILVSTKNDLMKSTEMASECEQWVNDLGKELNVTQCFHVSCKPHPINVCFAVDSLLAMALGGDTPEGEPSFVRRKSNHSLFMEAATNLAYLFAGSTPDTYLTWRTWKECGGAAQSAYRALIQVDRHLGEILARCLHRYRILQRVLIEHSHCCFAGDTQRLNLSLLALSVGKTTPENLEAAVPDPNHHQIWRRVKSLPVMGKGVNPSVACLYHVLAAVTQNSLNSRPPKESLLLSTRADGCLINGTQDEDDGNGTYVDIPGTPGTPDEGDSVYDQEYEVMGAFQWANTNGAMGITPKAISDGDPDDNCVQDKNEIPEAMAPPTIFGQQTKGRQRCTSEPAQVPERCRPPGGAHAHMSVKPRTLTNLPEGRISSTSSIEDNLVEVTHGSPTTNEDYAYPLVFPRVPPQKAIGNQSSRNLDDPTYIRCRQRGNAIKIKSRPPMPGPKKDHSHLKLPEYVVKRLSQLPKGDDHKQNDLAPSLLYTRQMSKSMEDLRKLHVDPIPDLPPRDYQTQTESPTQKKESRAYKNLPIPYRKVSSSGTIRVPTPGAVNRVLPQPPCTLNFEDHATQQDGIPAAHTSSNGDGNSRSRYRLPMSAGAVETGQTVLRLAARHPTIPTAWFDINISVDVHTEGWEKAMEDLKTATRLSLSIRK